MERSQEEQGEPATSPGKGASMGVLLGTQEVYILALGFVCAACIAFWFLLLEHEDPSAAGQVLAMVGSHLTGGRAAGITMGLGFGMSRVEVISLGSLIEGTVVCIFFAIFSLSVKKLITSRMKLFNDVIARLQRSANEHRWRLRSWGIPGLILFVWFPFFMTGPVIGSVLGLIIGMRPWLTVATVLGGTVLALVSWTFLIDPLVKLMETVGQFVPLLVVCFLVVLALAYRAKGIRDGVLAAANDKRGGPPAGGATLLLLLVFLVSAFSGSGCVTTIGRRSPGPEVDLAKAVIAIPVPGQAAAQEAAEELQRHLQLAYGHSPPIIATPGPEPGAALPGYTFLVGFGSEAEGPPGSYGYRVARDRIAFWGSGPAVADPGGRAIHAFLETACGIRWPTPEDSIVLPSYRSGFAPRRGTVRGRQAYPCTMSSVNDTQLDQTLGEATVPQGNERRIREWLERLGVNRVPPPAPELVGRVQAWVTGLPVGCELDLGKTVHKLARQNHAVAVVGAASGWTPDGLKTYMALNATRPSGLSTAQTIEAFAAGFGTAAEPVLAYLEFWQQHYRDRLRKNLKALECLPAPLALSEFHRLVPSRFAAADFEAAGQILTDAMTRDRLDWRTRGRLEELALAHYHAELIFRCATGLDALTESPEALGDVLKWLTQLHALRRDFAPRLNGIETLARREALAGDVTGKALLSHLTSASVLTPMPATWRTRAVPEVGSPDAGWWSIQEVDQLASWDASTARLANRPAAAAGGMQSSRRLWACYVAVPPEQVDEGGVTFLFWGVRGAFKLYVNGLALGSVGAAGIGGAQAVDVPATYWRRGGRQLVAVEGVAADQGLWRAAWMVRNLEDGEP